MVRACSTLGTARGITPVGDQPKEKPLWARNPTALKDEASWSYRKLAKKVGNNDPRAVSKHCNGLRKPENHTLAEYAQAFTRRLGRTITVEQIRNGDVSPPLADSST
jgi:hypothetical protein